MAMVKKWAGVTGAFHVLEPLCELIPKLKILSFQGNGQTIWLWATDQEEDYCRCLDAIHAFVVKIADASRFQSQISGVCRGW